MSQPRESVLLDVYVIDRSLLCNLHSPTRGVTSGNLAGHNSGHLLPIQVLGNVSFKQARTFQTLILSA